MWLISEVGEIGKVRQCDARCYDAHGPKCDCVCGGSNHGRGLAGALRNMEGMILELLEDRDRGKIVVNTWAMSKAMEEAIGPQERSESDAVAV